MIRILFAVFIGLGLASCTDDFSEINTDPNAPTEVPTSYLITDAERQLVNQLLGQTAIGEIGQHYAQYLSQNQYTSVTRYATQNTSFYGAYRSGLQDLQFVIDQAQSEDEAVLARVDDSGPLPNQIALATIMQQWAFLTLTDIWGDIPYSEALLGPDNLSPVYDEQEFIYREAVRKLTESGDMIVGGSVSGDLIFGGDMSKWYKFANSLILRAGLRVSNVDPDLGAEWTNLAIDRGVMESIDDNAALRYTGTGGFGDNGWYTNSRTRTDYVVSEPLIDYMLMVDDPRIGIYADPTGNSADTDTLVYSGKPYGVTEAVAANTKTADVSFPGYEYFYSPTAPLVLLTYSEVLFNQAEAAARGWTEGDAEELYNAAITASMNQYGITDQTAIDAYIAQPEVAYNADNFAMSIGNQKWLALYFQGIEGWSEWRRLGYPELAPAPAALNSSGQIPRRRAYTNDEFALNQANYEAAVQRQFGGTDSIDGRVWWDVE